MIEALNISESGLHATQKWIDSISNNVANMQTVGYKKMSVNFSNMVNQPATTGAPATADNQEHSSYGIGTQIASVNSVFTSGSIKSTKNELDIAIQGNGFFEVIRSDGTFAYTRAGQFKVNSDGVLTTRDGLPLSADIRVPPDVSSIQIEANGNLKGLVASTGEVIELGELRVANVIDPQSLKAVGNGLYVNDSSANDSADKIMLESAGTNGTGQLLQGFLEMSNVDLIEEMSSLVLAQRAYQLNARIIQTADQVMETINNLRR